MKGVDDDRAFPACARRIKKAHLRMSGVRASPGARRSDAGLDGEMRPLQRDPAEHPGKLATALTSLGPDWPHPGGPRQYHAVHVAQHRGTFPTGESDYGR